MSTSRTDTDSDSEREIEVYYPFLKLSDALCDFLEIPRGTVCKMREITTMFYSYAKRNNLMEERGHRIIRNDAIDHLFGLTGRSVELTIFNLQKYLAKHRTLAEVSG